MREPLDTGNSYYLDSAPDKETDINIAVKTTHPSHAKLPNMRDSDKDHPEPAPQIKVGPAASAQSKRETGSE